jgi:hypothetical protein
LGVERCVYEIWDQIGEELTLASSTMNSGSPSTLTQLPASSLNLNLVIPRFCSTTNNPPSESNMIPRGSFNPLATTSALHPAATDGAACWGAMELAHAVADALLDWALTPRSKLETMHWSTSRLLKAGILFIWSVPTGRCRYSWDVKNRFDWRSWAAQGTAGRRRYRLEKSLLNCVCKLQVRCLSCRLSRWPELRGGARFLFNASILGLAYSPRRHHLMPPLPRVMATAIQNTPSLEPLQPEQRQECRYVNRWFGYCLVPDGEGRFMVPCLCVGSVR